MKRIFNGIRDNFSNIEYLLAYTPFYYFWMTAIYFMVFLFDEGMNSLLKWEENLYAKLTTQTFDSILHIYYYMFYLISLIIAIIHFVMTVFGEYIFILSKKHDFMEIKGQIFKNLLKFTFLAYLLIFCNIYGNYKILEYYSHGFLIELWFIVLGYFYGRIIYLNVFAYKHSKNQDEINFFLLFGFVMGVGIMRSIFCLYVLIFDYF